MSDQRRLRLAIAGSLILVVVAAAIALVSNGYDAIAYRNAAERLLATGSPYQPFQLEGPFDPASPGRFSYLYPPPFALFLTPLLLLPPEAAKLLFAVGSVVASLAAFTLVFRHGGLRAAVAFPLAVLAAAVCYPVLDDAINGNVSALLGLAVALLISDGARRSGAAVAAASLLKLTPAALLPVVLLRGGVAFRATVATGLLLALPTLPFLAAWADFPVVVANLAAFGPSQHHASVSPAETATLLLGSGAYPPVRALTLAAAGGLALLTLGATLLRQPTVTLVAALYVSLLLPATLWPHYLIAPAVLTCSLAVRSGGRLRFLLLATGLAALTLPELLALPLLRLPALPLLIAASLAAAWRLDDRQRSPRADGTGS